MPGQRHRWVKGVCVFRCNLPPALLVEWPGCFMCHCGNMGVERAPNRSQYTKLTLEKKLLPPLLPGFELATFRSRVRSSYQRAIPAPHHWNHVPLTQSQPQPAPIKHILTECADLVEVRKKHWRRDFCTHCSETWIRRKLLTSWKRVVCSTECEVCWSKYCVKKYFNCAVEILWFDRNVKWFFSFVCVCVCMCVKYVNCVVETLWLVLNDLCAE